MPLHDWTKVPAGLFHHFHQGWSFEIARASNAGRLPKGLTALVEQRSGPLEADVLAVERRRPRQLDLKSFARPRKHFVHDARAAWWFAITSARLLPLSKVISAQGQSARNASSRWRSPPVHEAAPLLLHIGCVKTAFRFRSMDKQLESSRRNMNGC